MTRDYNVQIKIRNGRLLRKMRERGLSVADLARATKSSVSRNKIFNRDYQRLRDLHREAIELGKH